MERLTSERSATIEQFLDLFAKTLKAAWNSPTQVEVDVYEAFPPELKDTNDQNKKLPPLIVTWEYVREIHPEMGEKKPRQRQNIADPKNPNSRIVTYGQRFMCTVSFDLWSYDKEILKARNEQFGDFMVAFTGFFKSQGVAEIIFINENNIVHPYRESLYGRRHLYRVDIEKVTRVDTAVIQTIITHVMNNGEYVTTETLNKEE